MARLLLCFLLIISCSYSQERLPKEMSIICGIDDEKLGKDFKVVSFAIEGRQLQSDEINVATYEVTKEGCAIIPPEASKPIKVKSGDRAAVLAVSSLKKKFTPKLELLEVDGTDPAFSYCGENIDPQQSAMKFLFPSDLSEDSYFIDSENEKTPIILNDLYCAVVPRKTGKIVFDGNKHTFVPEAKKLQIIEKANTALIGFETVCKELGQKDRVVSILSKLFSSDDCSILKSKTRELLKDDKNIFVGQGIENIGALHDLEFESLNLSKNPIFDLSPLSSMNTLSRLEINDTNIMSLSGIPETVKSLYLGDTPYLENLCDAHKYLKNLLVKDYKSLKSFKCVDKLSLSSLSVYNGSEIADKQNIANSTTIKEFWLINSTGYDSVLESWKNENMIDINISGCGLKSSRFLKNFPNIRTVNLIINKISDFRSVNQLKSIESLKITDNPVTDLSYLSSQSLQFLSMRLMDVSTIDFVSNLPALKSLSINRTNVSDLSPLVGKEIDDFTFSFPKQKISTCPIVNVSDAVRNYCLSYNNNNDT